MLAGPRLERVPGRNLSWLLAPGSWRVQVLLAASLQSGPLPLLPTPSSYQDTVISRRAHPGNSPRAHLKILTSICKCSFPKEGPIHRFWGLGCGSTFWGCRHRSITTASFRGTCSVVGDSMPRTLVHRLVAIGHLAAPGVFSCPGWSLASGWLGIREVTLGAGRGPAVVQTGTQGQQP